MKGLGFILIFIHFIHAFAGTHGGYVSFVKPLYFTLNESLEKDSKSN